MKFAETEAELTRLLRAGYGLAVLESFEEKRSLRLAENAAAKVGLPLLTWSVSRGLSTAAGGGTSLADALAAFRKSNRPGLLALLGVNMSALTLVERRLLAEVAAEGASAKQHLLAIAPLGEVPEELQREAALLMLAPPDEDELKVLLEETAKAMNVQLGDSAADSVAAARGLGLEEARRVFRLALQDMGDVGGEDPAKPAPLRDPMLGVVSTVLAEKRRVLQRNSAIDCIELTKDEAAGLNLVGGLELLKQWLADRKKSLTSEARAFGLPPPKGLLLLGVQGCGKSLSAKAITAEWHMPLCRLDLSGLFTGSDSPAVGMRRAIASVEAMAPVVLWIDELEKAFAGVDSGGDAALARLFGWFIIWLGERTSPVFVVATANDVTHLPPEMLRKGRFDETFFVDLPNEKARIEILGIHLRRRGRDPDALPLAAISKRSERYSGAELEQLVVAALHMAFSKGRDLTGEDLWTALHETVPLYKMYEEKIRALRAWAQDRARPAEARPVELLQQR